MIITRFIFSLYIKNPAQMGIITDIFVATEAADIPIVWDVLAIAKKILIKRRPINKLAENQLFDVSSAK
jgi:hypothetical protein